MALARSKRKTLAKAQAVLSTLVNLDLGDLTKMENQRWFSFKCLANVW